MEIEKPCSENYKNMFKSRHGSYCQVCEKMVVDFTRYTNEDLKKYFVEHKQEATCGRFKITQIKTNNNFTNQIYHLEKWIQTISFNPLKLALLTLFSGLFTLTSCIMGKAIDKNVNSKWNDNTKTDTLKVESKQNEIKK